MNNFGDMVGLLKRLPPQARTALHSFLSVSRQADKTPKDTEEHMLTSVAIRRALDGTRLS